MKKYLLLDEINEVEAKQFTDTLLICKHNNRYWIFDEGSLKHIVCEKTKKSAIEKYVKVKELYETTITRNSYKNLCKNNQDILKGYLKLRKNFNIKC